MSEARFEIRPKTLAIGGRVVDKSGMSDPAALLPDPDPRPGGTRRLDQRALGLLIAVNIAVELVLQGADHHLWGTTLWRGQAYQNGGFWVGLLHDWHPNYRVQPVTMFLTYSLLHAGLSHLIGNMMSLTFLGDMVLTRLQDWGVRAQAGAEPDHGERGGSARGLIRLYVAASLGGALTFGLLSHSPAPMIGASGAIFGLAGALTVWDAQARRAQGLWNRGPLIVGGLAGLNLVLWISASGNLAWETHLGGFATGALLALYPGLLTRPLRAPFGKRPPAKS